ncbi:MAG TPA: aspartyl/asparaginyl beta-hydroxylase domain-containing protein [Sphingomicrobium sp.]|nr:aspartyl/asparaginyl beta-hydroxylase domain-containing protein [Sphingomicrobium sp.]
MRIERPLLRLPIRFCPDTLAREVGALPSDAWTPHPAKFDGNMAVPLVTPGGAITDECAGPMGPTEALGHCPYIAQIMRELDSTWGRSRLMSLEPGAVVPPHVDTHYYWRTHLRIHVPVITNPKVSFTCADETVHMAAGECWLLDSFFRHQVENGGKEDRVHLVLDTVGSARLWDLIEAALAGADDEYVAPGDSRVRQLAFEQVNSPAVMSPWEMKAHIAYLFSWMDEDPRLAQVEKLLDRFVMTWNGSWARFGTSDEGVPTYARHLQEIQAELARFRRPPILMRNGWPLLDSFHRFVLANAIAPSRLRETPRTQADAPYRLTA